MTLTTCMAERCNDISILAQMEYMLKCFVLTYNASVKGNY